jgi:hypothetical protein
MKDPFTVEQRVKHAKLKIVLTVVIMAVVLIHSYVTTGSLTATWFH